MHMTKSDYRLLSSNYWLDLARHFLGPTRVDKLSNEPLIASVRGFFAEKSHGHTDANIFPQTTDMYVRVYKNQNWQKLGVCLTTDRELPEGNGFISKMSQIVLRFPFMFVFACLCFCCVESHCGFIVAWLSGIWLPEREGNERRITVREEIFARN